MNFLSKKLIIAVAGAMLVFATGCTKKASRPTPDQTMLPGGSANATDTPFVDPNYNPTGYGTHTTTMPAPTELMEKTASDGDLVGNQLRNIPGLQAIYFGFDRSAIEAKERSKFQAIKEYLAKNPQYRLLFEGHCDWRGTAEYNMALGDRRANSAKRYAVSIGIDPAKIEVRSMGSTKATERASDEVMAKDRRAEVVMIVK